jgi:hypothetical protein
MATITITKVTCDRKQDVIGEDEAEIWLDGHMKWSNTMKKNQSRDLSLSQDFTDSIAVEIKERNPNSSKSLGVRTVEEHNPGVGPLDFKTSGADYKLNYHVK